MLQEVWDVSVHDLEHTVTESKQSADSVKDESPNF